MRDAQSLLDQIISFSGEAVDSEDVRDVLGFIPGEILDRTIDSISASNASEMIDIVSVVVDQGLSLQQYVRELIARMRDMLMIKLRFPDKVLGTDEEKAELARRAESFSEQDLIRYFDLLLRLENDTRYSAQPRFHLEVGLVKLAKAGHMKDIEEVLRDLKQGVPPAKPEAPVSPAPPPRPSLSPSPSAPPNRVPPAAPTTKAMSPAPSFQTSAPKPSPSPSPMVAASAAAPAPISKPESKATVGDNAMDSARQEPLVKSFLAVFRGDIAQVKPPKGESE
jgi:DNA polymerase-3 subunit gamma/tau